MPGMKDLGREHWSRVIKEETSALQEKWENAFNEKQLDSSFNHGSRSGQWAQSSSPTSKAPTQTDKRKPYKYGNLRGESPPGLRGKRPCKKNPWRNEHRTIV